MASLVGYGVIFHLPGSGSNAKNKNKSPMLIPTLFHEAGPNHKQNLHCHPLDFVHRHIQFSQSTDL